MKASIKVEMKADGMTVSLDFDLDNNADKDRFKATCSLLSRPELSCVSRERFLKQIIAGIDGIVMRKTTSSTSGQLTSQTSSLVPKIRTALDLAIERSSQQKITRVARENAPAKPTREPLDLSEILEKKKDKKG